MNNSVPVEPSASDTLWFYTDENNQPVGPISLNELKRLVATGTISRSTLVIAENGSEWESYQTLFAAVPPVPPPITPPPLSPQGIQKSPRRWPAVVSVLLLFPFGLIALWMSKGYSKFQKWTMIGVSSLLFAASIGLHRPGFILLVLVANILLFTWWAERIKRVWKIVITAAACLMFLPPAFMESAKQPEYPTTQSSTSAIPLATPELKPESEPVKKSSERLKIGQEFRLGNYSYKVLGARNIFEVGGGYSRETPSHGAVFVEISYQIKNESNKTQTVMSDDFLLRDKKGREFRPSSNALSALAMSGRNKDFILSELQPGLAKRTQTIFEVPIELMSERLVLVIPEKGWGAGEREVLLSK